MGVDTDHDHADRTGRKLTIMMTMTITMTITMTHGAII